MQPERRAHGKEVLENHCVAQGWLFQRVASGMNYRSAAFQPGDIISGKMGRLVLDRKDRLLRFGAEPVSQLAKSAASHG
jgi:hypothetical protein